MALNAALILADGQVFFGRGIGKSGVTMGEICFNTALTGYQEVMTDPSYAGQIITFTFPHIGNVGTNEEDVEADKVFAKGLILREAITQPSNFRHQHHFNDWLIKHEITGISGIDTRRLTRHIREHGAQNALIGWGDFVDMPRWRQMLQQAPQMEGLDLAKDVTSAANYAWEKTRWQLGKGYGKLEKPQYHVVAIDYGEKQNILRSLAHYGCRVTVVPAKTTADAILKLQPDGVFLSNGPGDPAATGEYAVPVLKQLIALGMPIFGICLGHQMLALALGAKTKKMHQGHRGANHPVKNLENGRVEITSQNHGFVVDGDSLPKGVVATHISLFDHSVEGLRLLDKPVFSVQYHPESSPGPHDSLYLFENFIAMMEAQKQSAQKKKASHA